MQETQYGCCQDGNTPRENKRGLNCLIGGCAGTQYGCCPNRKTASNKDGSNCRRPTEKLNKTALILTLIISLIIVFFLFSILLSAFTNNFKGKSKGKSKSKSKSKK